MEEVEICYGYKGMVYRIIGTEGLHNQLENDHVFFESYVTSNVGSLEVEAPDHTKDYPQGSHDKLWTWSRAHILDFLDCVQKKKLDFRNPKIKKKDLWSSITLDMKKKGHLNIDDSVVERKYRNMKNTYKAIKDNKRKNATGRGAVKWEYFDAMEEVFEEDKTINIGPTISSFATAGFSQISSCARSISPVAHSSKTSPMSFGPTTPVPAFSINLPQPDCEATYVTKEISRTSLANLTPRSKTLKSERGRKLYGLRKKQLEVEEKRIEELQLLRLTIEESNRIQRERNELLKDLLKKLS